MHDVAIVICNYNKREYVISCIESILKSNFKNYDLIVVDNASTDDSVAVIRENYGDRLTLLVNEKNLGGSGGFNRGMAYAMSQKKYKYIHLLDNDVVVDADAIGKLYEFMEAHPGAGACGSLVLRMDFPETIQDYGAVISVKDFGAKALYGGEVVTSALPEFVECDYIAACSAMYRCAALETAGLIEEDYFIYWDDIAFCWKLRLAGYPIYACAASRVLHKVGKLGRNSSFALYYFFRNKVHSIVKYCTDDEYKELAEDIVTRIFRTFAVNTKSNNAIYAYFHALNDALNDIRGKADSYKLEQRNDPELMFANRLVGARSILILFSKDFITLETLIVNIRNISPDIDIAIASGGESMPRIDNATILTETPTYKEYDVVLKLCNHILDLADYDRTLIYCDRYLNQLVDDEDFDFVMDLDNHFKFFYKVFYPFVKSKLDDLRQKYGHTLSE